MTWIFVFNSIDFQNPLQKYNKKMIYARENVTFLLFLHKKMLRRVTAADEGVICAI